LRIHVLKVKPLLFRLHEDDGSLTDYVPQFPSDFAALKMKWSGMKFAALARKYDPNQPRVPAGNSDGGQWTSTGGEGGDSESFEDLVQPVFAPAVPPAIAAVEAALALFAGLSALNSRNSRAIFEFNARGYDRDGDVPNFAASRLLNRDEVDSECPRLNEVQQRTDFAAANINRADYARASEYGTAVHKNLADQIRTLVDPNLHAEVSLTKTREALRYGEAGSIRIDIFERVGNGTVCVYDIKTGSEGLNLARFHEIAARVLAIYGDTTRIVISEIRPGR
jgi:hypothetical protein